MSDFSRFRTVFYAVAMSLFCQAGFASVLDLSAYPDNTPLDQVNVPGFTFVVTPGVAAFVNDGKISLGGAVQGIDLRIIFSGLANESTVEVDGSGSCQDGSDYVYWYFDDALVDTFESFDRDPSDFVLEGRCLESTLYRSFPHTEISVDVFPNQSMRIGPLSNDVEDYVATPVPLLSPWAMILMSVLILLGAATTLTGKFARKF